MQLRAALDWAKIKAPAGAGAGPPQGGSLGMLADLSLNARAAVLFRPGKKKPRPGPGLDLPPIRPLHGGLGMLFGGRTVQMREPQCCSCRVTVFSVDVFTDFSGERLSGCH